MIEGMLFGGEAAATLAPPEPVEPTAESVLQATFAAGLTRADVRAAIRRGEIEVNADGGVDLESASAHCAARREAAVAAFTERIEKLARKPGDTFRVLSSSWLGFNVGEIVSREKIVGAVGATVAAAGGTSGLGSPERAISQAVRDGEIAPESAPEPRQKSEDDVFSAILAHTKDDAERAELLVLAAREVSFLAPVELARAAPRRQSDWRDAAEARLRKLSAEALEPLFAYAPGAKIDDLPLMSVALEIAGRSTGEELAPHRAIFVEEVNNSDDPTTIQAAVVALGRIGAGNRALYLKLNEIERRFGRDARNVERNESLLAAIDEAVFSLFIAPSRATNGRD
jgi:hypothetical protein